MYKTLPREISGPKLPESNDVSGSKNSEGLQKGKKPLNLVVTEPIPEQLEASATPGRGLTGLVGQVRNVARATSAPYLLRL